MKKLFTFVIAASLALAASAQYTCTEVGTVLSYAYTATNDGVKNESTVTRTIIEATPSADGTVNVIAEEVLPVPGNDFARITQYLYSAYNAADSTTTIVVAGEEDSKAVLINTLKISLEAAGQTITDSQLKELDESIRVKGELKLTLKSGIAAGTKIPNQTLRLTLGTENMVMNIWEASYGGYEAVEVPAGTFECIKVQYVQNFKMGANRQKSSVTDWYAPGIGLVRSISADKKGNEVNRTELISVKK